MGEFPRLNALAPTVHLTDSGIHSFQRLTIPNAVYWLRSAVVQDTENQCTVLRTVHTYILVLNTGGQYVLYSTLSVRSPVTGWLAAELSHRQNFRFLDVVLYAVPISPIIHLVVPSIRAFQESRQNS